MKKILLLCLLVNLLISGRAQDGQLDQSFGKGGIVITDMGVNDSSINNDTNAERILLNPDGSMYLISAKLGVDLLYIRKKDNDGKPDLSYGKNGYSTTLKISGQSPAMLQQDGKIVIVGNVYESSKKFYSVVYRLNTNGSLDSTFNGKGFKKSSFNNSSTAADLTIQKDGKIIVSGSTLLNDTLRYLLFRLNTDGSLDTPFTQLGKLTDSVEIYSSVTLQDDGKIIAGGYKKNSQGDDIFTPTRYNANGNLDTAFRPNNGVPTKEFVRYRLIKILVDGDENILVAGTISNNFGIARFKKEGNFDTLVTTSFASSFNINYLRSALIESDGKIVLMGSAEENGAAVVSYNKDLSINTNFSQEGKLLAASDGFFNFANSLTIQTGGKILLSGSITRGNYPNIAVVRFNNDGTIDETFADRGKLYEFILQGNTAFSAAAVQNDGKVVAGGSAFNGLSVDFAMARYNTNGSLDSTFSTDGKVTADAGNQITINSIRALAIQTDGKIIAGGNGGTGNVLVRYRTNGSIEHTYEPVSSINTIAIKKNGKFIVGIRNGLARYNNLSVDKSFNGLGFLIFPTIDNFEFTAKAIALQKDEKIIVLGNSFGSHFSTVLRYDTNGKLDSSFGTNGIVLNYSVLGGETSNAVAVQTDDKILIGGSYSNFSDLSTATFSIFRLNNNGSWDSTFNAGRILHPFTEGADVGNSIKIQTDGKIIIAGNSVVEGLSHFKIARFYSNGSVDKSFNATGSVTTYPGGAYANLANITIQGNNIYAVGDAVFPGRSGIIAKYRLCNAPEVLPLQINFDGQLQNNKTLLNWQVENQQKLQSFTLKKSRDSIHFNPIESIAANNNNLLKAAYLTVDKSPFIGANFYRLKLKNTDSTIIYSQLVTVNLMNDNLRLKISPNPAKSRLVVTTNGENEKATIKILDIFGRKFKELQVSVNGNTSFSVDIDALPNGIYNLKLIKKSTTEISSFVKQ